MSLVCFVLLVIGVAGFALNIAYDGGDGRAIKPSIVAERRIGFSTEGDKVPVEGVRLYRKRCVPRSADDRGVPENIKQ